MKCSYRSTCQKGTSAVACTEEESLYGQRESQGNSSFAGFLRLQTNKNVELEVVRLCLGGSLLLLPVECWTPNWPQQLTAEDERLACVRKSRARESREAVGIEDRRASECREEPRFRHPCSGTRFNMESKASRVWVGTV